MISQIDTVHSIEQILNDYGDLLGNVFVNRVSGDLLSFKNRSADTQNQLRTTSDDNLKIAVVGAFSCGKSTFINSILGDEVAPVEITPKTHGVTSFLYGAKEKYDADGRQISRKEYQDEVQDGDNTVKHFLVEYPCERLKNFEFMDSPGFASVSGKNEAVAKKDALLSDQAVKLADVVFFLTNITEGVIQGDALSRLENICKGDSNALNPHRKIFVILTWADRKSPGERINVQKSIQNLCEEHNLPIEGVLLYSSLDIDKFKSQQTKEFFGAARENLFSTLVNLRSFRIELKTYRQAIKKHFEDRELQRILQSFVHGVDEIIEAQQDLISHELEADFNKKWLKFREEAADIIYSLFEEKDKGDYNPFGFFSIGSVHDQLVTHEESKLFSKSKVEMCSHESLVVLDEKEVKEIISKIEELGNSYGFKIAELKKTKLKKFLTVSRLKEFDWEDAAYDSSRGGCYCSERYLRGSIGDAYLRICVEMITSLGGPWYYYETDEELSTRADRLKKELSGIFDANARDHFIDLIDGEMKKIVFQSVIEPLLSKAKQRIEELTVLIDNIKEDNALSGNCTMKPATSKGKSSSKTLKANDIFNELF